MRSMVSQRGEEPRPLPLRGGRAKLVASLRPPAGRIRRPVRALGEIPAAAVRRRYYLESDIRLERLPPRFRRRLGLEDVTAVGSRRIEIGSGSRPQPGYIHVDIGLMAAHVEFFGSADALPFRSDWAEEISAVDPSMLGVIRLLGVHVRRANHHREASSRSDALRDEHHLVGSVPRRQHGGCSDR